MKLALLKSCVINFFVNFIYPILLFWRGESNVGRLLDRNEMFGFRLFDEGSGHGGLMGKYGRLWSTVEFILVIAVSL